MSSMNKLRPCNLVLFTGTMDWTGVTILFFFAEASSAARLLSGHFKPKHMQENLFQCYGRFYAPNGRLHCPHMGSIVVVQWVSYYHAFENM